MKLDLFEEAITWCDEGLTVSFSLIFIISLKILRKPYILCEFLNLSPFNTMLNVVGKLWPTGRKMLQKVEKAFFYVKGSNRMIRRSSSFNTNHIVIILISRSVPAITSPVAGAFYPR